MNGEAMDSVVDACGCGDPDCRWLGCVHEREQADQPEVAREAKRPTDKDGDG